MVEPQRMDAARGPAIRCVDVSKQFPGVLALRNVSLEVAAGTCHALCGENGAGKSTLGKVLAGIHRPDAGTIQFHGRDVQFAEPRDALAAGIGMVHQELAFCEQMTVAENLCLGAFPHRYGFVDRRAMRQRAEALIADVAGADAPSIDVRRAIGDLSVGQRQLLQIATAVGSGASLLVLDEPTSSLSEHEATHLYDLVSRLTARGVTLLYVSHRMYELFQLCDTVTVLRDGQHVATRPTAEYTEAEIVRLMVGRTVEGYVRGKAVAATNAAATDATTDAAPVVTPKSVMWPPRLRVQGLSSPGKFEDVSFSVAPGEIVGLAGLIGAGRTEVMEALFGLDPAVRGRIRIDDVEVTVRSPRAAMRHAMGLVPEDRKRQGMVLSLSGRENLALPTLERFSNFLWVSRPRERTVATHYFSQLNVRAPGIETVAATLSGGNQQKIVLAKWLAARCRILLLDEPTRGVDVAAKAEIHALIDGLARDGVAIVLVSSELPELLSLADRVLVMRQGRIVTELVDTDQPTVLRWMAGVEA